MKGSDPEEKELACLEGPPGKGDCGALRPETLSRATRGGRENGFSGGRPRRQRRVGEVTEVCRGHGSFSEETEAHEED